MQQAEEQRQRLLKQLNQVLQTRDSARGLIVSMSDVLFDFNQATLKPGAKLRLAKVSGIIMTYPDLKLEIDGFTDNKGTPQYNMTLSDKRAKAVRDFLVSQGVGDRCSYYERIRRIQSRSYECNGRRTPTESQGGISCERKCNWQQHRRFRIGHRHNSRFRRWSFRSCAEQPAFSSRYVCPGSIATPAGTSGSNPLRRTAHRNRHIESSANGQQTSDVLNCRFAIREEVLRKPQHLFCRAV